VQQSGGAGFQGGFPLATAAPRRVRWIAAPLAALEHRLDAEQARLFLWLPVALGCGIALYFAAAREPTWITALVPVFVALVVRSFDWRSLIALVGTAALLAVAAGLAIAKVRTEWVRAPVLAKPLGASDVDGFVELVEPRPGKAQRLTLRVIAIASVPAAGLPTRVRIRLQRETPGLKPGDAVRLKASLSPPPVPALPGDYDFARSAWFASLGAVGFGSGPAVLLSPTPEPPPSLRVFAAIERVRQAIGQRIAAALPGEVGAIANALITGERGGISEATNQAFRDSGLYHILSISGLHMTIVAAAAFVGLRMLLAAVPAIVLRYPVKKWAAVGAMLATLGYLLISGSAFATLRSYMMISVMFLAVLLDRPALALRNVAVAALLILLAWPESLLDAGFQMSFAAVVALVSAYEWMRDRRSEDERTDGLFGRGVLTSLMFLGGIVLTTLIASLAVAPFGIYHFHNVQAFAVLANLIAIPICNLIVMPVALLAMLAMPFGLEAGPLWLMGLGIEVMTWCARSVASLPGAVGRLPAIPTLAFAAMVAGGLWLMLWRTRWRLLGLVSIALGVAMAPLMPRPDVLVGRGGELVAVRGPDGRLTALPARGVAFDLARWLEHDGDIRPAAEVQKGNLWRCDAVGCTVRVAAHTIAVARSPAALNDDCRDAHVLVLRFNRAAPCSGARLVMDRARLQRLGAHAVYLGTEAGAGRSMRVDTVAEARGDRPWSRRAASMGSRTPEAATPQRSVDEAADHEP
jgi:competence protein ComEC